MGLREMVIAGLLGCACSTPQISPLPGNKHSKRDARPAMAVFEYLPFEWTSYRAEFEFEGAALGTRATGTASVLRNSGMNELISKINYAAHFSPSFFGIEDAVGNSFMKTDSEFRLLCYQEKCTIKRGGKEETFSSTMEYLRSEDIVQRYPDLAKTMETAMAGYLLVTDHGHYADPAASATLPAVQAALLLPHLLRALAEHRKHNEVRIDDLPLPPPLGFCQGYLTFHVHRVPVETLPVETAYDAARALDEERYVGIQSRIRDREVIGIIVGPNYLSYGSNSVGMPKLYMNALREGQNLVLAGATKDAEVRLCIDALGIKEGYCKGNLGLLGEFQCSIRRK